ncbi:MAG: VOC family protein [Dehalococcoidia bacterium]
MAVKRVDHVVVAVPSVEEAAEAYERLGLRLSPLARHRGLGTENRAMFVHAADGEFYVELLGIHDRAAALGSSRGMLYLEAIERGGGLARLMLGVEGLGTVVAKLAAAGHGGGVEAIYRERGDKLAEVAALEGLPGLGINAGLIEYAETQAERVSRHEEAGLFAHGFPLKRLDHLAAIAPDLEGATRAWTDGLGIAVHGEVAGRGMVIRQMKVGDAIVELLGPESPESPIASRPPGLASMCAWEVEDLDAAVALARERWFSPSEPVVGVLPGTRVATIPAAELAGLGMQLLEYV